MGRSPRSNVVVLHHRLPCDVQLTGMLCGYDLPGGAIAMEFTPNSVEGP